ncbi:MAG: hypothetical protein D6785_16050, partial [Planctomycetota bacterium]
YEKLGQNKKALKWYWEYLKHDNNPSLWEKVASLAEKIDSVSIACQAYSKLLEKYPQNLAYRRKRYLLEKILSQRDPSSKTHWEEDLLFLSQKKPVFILDLAREYVKKGKEQKGIEIYKKAWEKLKDSPEKVAILKAMEDLGILFIDKKWVQANEFLGKKKFVSWKGEWLSPLEFKLVQFLSKENPSFSVQRPDKKDLEVALQGGVVIKGMNKKEVTQVLGFWDKMQKRRWKGHLAEIYYFSKSQQYIYFIDGRACKIE